MNQHLELNRVRFVTSARHFHQQLLSVLRAPEGRTTPQPGVHWWEPTPIDNVAPVPNLEM